MYSRVRTVGTLISPPLLPHKISVEKVREFLLEHPELVAATARDQLVEGVALLVRLQARELSHHTLQPDWEGLAEINHLLFYCS